MYLNNYFTLPLADGEKPNYKELIPPALSRRMKPLLKNGVYAALKVIDALDENVRLDGIITATGLGAMKDTVNFANEVAEDESLISPTPFIQSTHNTLGGQIALLRSIHGYNNTHIHNYFAFYDALVEADILLNHGGFKHLLVGFAEDEDDVVSKWYENVHQLKGQWNTTAGFMHLSTEKTENSIAKLKVLEDEEMIKKEGEDVLNCKIEECISKDGNFNFSMFYTRLLESLSDKKITNFNLSCNNRIVSVTLDYVK